MHDVKARVRDGVSLTESIHCVKEGDVCSPVLFWLCMNELMPDMWQTWRSTYLSLSEIFILALFGLQMTLFSFLTLLLICKIN